MDKQLIADMIEELEQAKRLIERRLRVLYDLEGDPRPKRAEARAFLEPTETSGIRADIDKRRQEIMAEVERVRAQAMAQVAAAKNGTSAAGGFGLGGALGGLRHMPSPQQGEYLERLRQQLVTSERPRKGGQPPNAQPPNAQPPNTQPPDKQPPDEQPPDEQPPDNQGGADEKGGKKTNKNQ